MAPKNLPPAAKQQKILTWFQDTMGVYTLKELEKQLPGIGSINGMHVKEYLQNLMDESLIRVEKIGSGNWYWSFRSDAKKQKEGVLHTLKTEEARLKTAIEDAEREIEWVMRVREEDEEMLDGNSGLDRKGLLEMSESLGREMEVLDAKLAMYSENDPAEILRKMEETKRLWEVAVMWTDRLECLESLLCGMVDRGQVGQIMAQACDDEYVEGEGLKDL
ncbi:meiotic nuclear division protein-like protein 1 [Calycina marina]|uniref:Meiotic nuclear division protein 1 n=1 Tax=Calycina marina TaxID=1763456 RepID=A0A9P7ZB47_9HELO|nr:meiotic nuclear division protein-like protein 1 [Calycina marina]